MFNKKELQTLRDTNLNLLDTIKKQQESIDRLTDKVMARDYQEYKALTDPLPAQKDTPKEEDSFVDIDDLTPQEGLKLIQQPETDGDEQ